MVCDSCTLHRLLVFGISRVSRSTYSVARKANFSRVTKKLRTSRKSFYDGSIPASRCEGTSSPICTAWGVKAPARTCQRAPCLSPWAPRPDRRNEHGGGLNVEATEWDRKYHYGRCYITKNILQLIINYKKSESQTQFFEIVFWKCTKEILWITSRVLPDTWCIVATVSYCQHNSVLLLLLLPFLLNH